MVNKSKSVDIFAHNGKIQAIVEMKYEASSVNLKDAIIQTSEYFTSFDYPNKFIGILEYITGHGDYEHYYNIFSILHYLESTTFWTVLPKPEGYWTGSGTINQHFQNLIVRPVVYNRLQKILFEENGCLKIKAAYGNHVSFSLDAIKEIENLIKNPDTITKSDFLVNHLLRLLFATGYLTNANEECFIFPNVEVKDNVRSIFTFHYERIFQNGYNELAEQFETFLFDNETRSTNLENAFLHFILANKHTLKPYIPPSTLAARKSGSTTTTVFGSDFELEINEAFFSTVLRLATLLFTTKSHIAFEKMVNKSKSVDIFAHNGKIQAIVEMKYEASSVSLKDAIIQASEYFTSFDYPYKFIGILGYINGNANSNSIMH
ncbi:hypothetical protein U1Q18_048039 [Sarracenia purpurea var. burkii]